MDDTSQESISSIDSKIQTSQQQSGGHHLAGGAESGPASGNLEYGTEDAPSGVPVQRSGEDQFKTSQQLREEHKKLDSSY